MPEKLNNFKKPVTKFLEIDILSNDKFNQTCSPSDFRFIKSTEHDSIDKSNLFIYSHNYDEELKITRQENEKL